MRTAARGLLACSVFSACLLAADIRGRVVDPSGAALAGAKVSAVGRTGVVAETTSSSTGDFVLTASDSPEIRVVVTAVGFRTETVAPHSAGTIRLEIAPQVDAIQVVGSSMDVAAAEQGSSMSIIPPEDVRRRNEPYAVDLLRYIPGVAFNQNGAPGSVTSLFLRGGNSNFTLVQIDGIPVNSFGGAFDFAHIPSSAIDRIEVIRGAQSAVYGSYANSGVIDFVTRKPESEPQLELLAEGGSYGEHRFAVTGTGTFAGFGIAASASRSDSDGPVVNSDYRNAGLLLNVTRRFRSQNIALHADFDSNEAGEPGPWGSDPKQTFGGIDQISRAKNNFGDYGIRYAADFSQRVREEIFGTFFLENIGFRSPYGHSFNQDLRGQGEARTIVSIARNYTTAFGVATGRERVKNSYITDAAFAPFPIDRSDAAVYWENRFEFAHKLFLNAGVRGEWIRTPEIPPDGFARPLFPASRVARANPKVAVGYLVKATTRLHASAGTGIRPPSGFELAFTDNPRLSPERTRSVDAGIEQRLANGRVQLDATYFYNRYYDLIVTLQGNLASLSHYTSANLANSRAQGAEFTAGVRPSRSVFITGSYTLLETRILSLDGSSLAPLPFSPGQPLTRRPEHSGSFVATYARGRLAVDVTGYFRGKALFEEPSFGASNGLFWNPGFANVGLNLNYTVARGLTAYGHLRNALNQHYEEVFGYPSPLLNFVAGMKWTIAKRR
jgi:outer membrane cobalamin receptor